MTYTKPEVLEIGEATEVILGAKFLVEIDENGETSQTDGDLED